MASNVCRSAAVAVASVTDDALDARAIAMSLMWPRVWPETPHEPHFTNFDLKPVGAWPRAAVSVYEESDSATHRLLSALAPELDIG
jgi:hypothetical protein